MATAVYTVPLLKTIRKMSHAEAQEAFRQHCSVEGVRRGCGKPTLHAAVGMALTAQITATASSPMALPTFAYPAPI